MKVFLKVNTYSHFIIYIEEVESGTKTLHKLKNGLKFKKIKSDYTKAIGVIANADRWDSKQYIYNIDDKDMIQLHIEQCFGDLESKLRMNIKDKLNKLEYGKLSEISKLLDE